MNPLTPTKRWLPHLKAVIACSYVVALSGCVVAPQVKAQRSERGSVSTSDLSGSVVVARDVGWAWSSWTRAEQTQGFLARAATIGEEVGEPYELYFLPGQRTSASGTRGGVILTFEPQTTLAFTWTPAPGFDLHGVETSVHVTFTRLGPLRTRVSVSHSGFYDGAHFDAMRAYYAAFWSETLARFWHYAGGRTTAAWPPQEALWPQTPSSVALTASHRQSKLTR